MTIAPVHVTSEVSSEVLAALMHTANTLSTNGIGVIKCDEGSLALLSRAQLLWANARFGDLLCVSSDQLINSSLSRFLVEPSDLRLSSEREHTAALMMRSASGERLTVDVRFCPNGANVWTVLLSTRGTTASREDDEQALRLQQTFHAVVERNPIPILASDEGMRLGLVNDAFAALVGVPVADLMGNGWMQYIHDDDIDAVFECVDESATGNAKRTIRVRRADGHLRLVTLQLNPVSTSARSTGFAGTIEDITDRRSYEERLHYQARHDPLTGLDNRSSLIERMNERMAKGPITSIFLDLDYFKVVNDELGHAAGDKLLVKVGERLCSVIRDGDFVARFGGDEYVVIGAETHSDEEALAFGQRILDAVSTTLRLQGISITPTASVGVARSTARQSPDDLLRECDIAMYRAKNEGRNRVAVCNDQVRQEAQSALTMATELRHALATKSLQVHFQPIVQLDIDTMCSVEALVRWIHPERGFISPEIFAPMAERHGMINDLTHMVLLNSCEQMMRWRAELGPKAPQRVNVNLSALQLSEDHLVSTVAEVLEQTGLEPQALCLEITEGLLMNNPDAARRVLRNLKKLGVWLAIDDFGTGYSSLARLRTFPLDFLKIDKAFINEMSDGHPEVVEVIINLARSLGMKSVAEGVEHAEQVEELRQMGCTHVQGWHYAKAMTTEELIKWAR